MVYYFLVIDGDLEMPKLLNVCYTFSMNPQLETITQLQLRILQYFVRRGSVYNLIVTGFVTGQMFSGATGSGSRPVDFIDLHALDNICECLHEEICINYADLILRCNFYLIV